MCESTGRVCFGKDENEVQVANVSYADIKAKYWNIRRKRTHRIMKGISKFIQHKRQVNGKWGITEMLHEGLQIKGNNKKEKEREWETTNGWMAKPRTSRSYSNKINICFVATAINENPYLHFTVHMIAYVSYICRLNQIQLHTATK